jgi:hypothetical protein
MKYPLFLLLYIPLLFIQGCNGTTPPVENTDVIRSIDPLSCQGTDEGSNCDMNWFLFKDPHDFPANIQVLVNDKKIFDECSRDGNVGVTRSLEKITIVLWNYIRLSGNEKFKLQINDSKDCYSGVSIFYLNYNQPYELKTSSDLKRVEINL